MRTNDNWINLCTTLSWVRIVLMAWKITYSKLIHGSSETTPLIWRKSYSLYTHKNKDFFYKKILTNNSWFQIDEHCTWYVFSCTGFSEERVERIVSTADGFVARHLTIRLNSMFQAVQLPTRISNLNTGLANVDWNTLALQKKKNKH